MRTVLTGGVAADEVLATNGAEATGRLPVWAWVVAGVLLLFACWVGMQVQLNQHGVDDFIGFYIGGQFARDGHLYDSTALAAAHQAVLGVERMDLSQPRAPYYYWLLSPLASLPYRTAYWVWFGMMLGASFLFVAVYPTTNRAMLIAASAISIPLAVAVGGQQDVSLVLLIFALAMRLHSRGRGLAAGLVMSLLSIKFHWFLLLPIPFVLRKEWRVLIGVAAGGAILLASSFLIAGGDWIIRWRRLTLVPVANSGLVNMPNLHGVLDGVAGSAWIEAVLTVCVVAMTFLAARQSRFNLSLAATMLGSMLLSRHSYLHDCAVLIPGLVEIICLVKSPVTRWLAIALLSPFPYFLPALLFEVRHGLVVVILIGATLASLCVAGGVRELARR
jgi:hypothetical protein